MKYAWLGCLLWGSLLVADQESEINVNSRYTVESVQFSGAAESNISTGLRKEITRLIGEKLNPGYLDDLARRIRRELHVRAVTHHVLRGDTPEHVKVVFEIKGRPRSYELSVPKFLYHSKQGWSAAVEGTVEIDGNRLTAGLVSDGDELSERYAGAIARYEKKKIGTERLGFRLQGATYHEQWNRTTREAAGTETYRARHSIAPVATIALAGPLTLMVGFDFESMEREFAAANADSANAVVTTLRYHRRMEGAGTGLHDLDAGYGLRAATSILGSDFIYARHRWELRYAFSRGRHTVSDDLMGGVIGGRAPLFERFVLGTSSTLRGWNKFDIDPLGGDRMVHNSVEYQYRVFAVFYDAGAVWNRGQPAVARHSVGVGLRRSGFSLAVAMPVREGRMEPLFMMGMNY